MQIYYFTPARKDKNIGRAINTHCELVTDPNAWIVIQDGDSMYVQPDWPQRVHDALEMDGDRFGLVGCYTNRLRGLHQLHEGRFSNDHDILNHYEIGKQYNGKGIHDIGMLGVAGVFMAFQKKTWTKVRGFQENTIAADTVFNNKVRAIGGRIGLIRGVYVYHAYRPWAKDNPWDATEHLR